MRTSENDPEERLEKLARILILSQKVARRMLGILTHKLSQTLKALKHA